MSIALRHRSDPAPRLAPFPGLMYEREVDAELMAVLQGRSEAEMLKRFDAGHRPYVAWRHGWPAAWGWVATQTADMGELGISFAMPTGERYLWNFATLEAHRGLGVYPRLLDAIVRAEAPEAERFWVAYAPENRTSASGIHKAGFATVAEISFDRSGSLAVRARAEATGRAAARLLGLPEVDAALSPC
jgi:ribosomal protein S18 acetylase RimI-like enzyme